MTPKEIIQRLCGKNLTNDDRTETIVKLKPGLETEDLIGFEKRLSVSVPEEIKALLRFTSGVDISSLGHLDFLGRHSFESEDVFPCGLPVLGDESGNFWVVDISKDTGTWGSVFFVSHDPPVVVVQALTFSNFLEQIAESLTPPYSNRLKQVKDKAVYKVYSSNSQFIELEEARNAADSILSAFAKEISDSFKIVDLRSVSIGSGFRVSGKVVRCKEALIFAVECQNKTGLFRHLFGRA